jgi:hypothetical protein
MNEFSIELIFSTDLNDKLTISIPNAKPTATDAQVQTAMERIIAAEAVVTNTGEPIAIQGANLIATETVDYDLSA